MVVDWAEVDNKSDIILGEEMVGFAFGLGFTAKEAWADVLDVNLEVLGYAKYVLLGKFVANLLVQLLQVVAVAY